MENVNYQFALSLLIITLGYALKRLKIITEKDGESLTRIIFNITLPAVIINTITTVKIAPSIALLTIIGFVNGAFIFLLTFFTLKKVHKDIRDIVSMAIPAVNIGLFAFPLVEALYGTNGLQYIAMYDIGNSIVVFVLCFFAAQYFSSQNETIDYKVMFKTMFKSIPLITYLASLAISILGVHLPSMFMDVNKIIGRANMPLSLMLLGIYLNFSFGKDSLRVMTKVISIKYIIGITLGILLYITMPFDNLFRHIVLLAPILPIPTIIISYAIQFKYDQKLVGALVNLTIIISFILAWFIFKLSPVS